MASSSPEELRTFLETLGVDKIKHTRKVGADLSLQEGSFLDHLTGVESILRAWGCPEDVCLAGLFHSIYGTESFQAFSLPCDDEHRSRVRTLIGARAEFLAYINCVMERGTLDSAAVAYRDVGHRDELNAIVDSSDGRPHVIRTRPGSPRDAVTHVSPAACRLLIMCVEVVGMSHPSWSETAPTYTCRRFEMRGDCKIQDPTTGTRHASIAAEHLLSSQELLELMTVHLADYLQQAVAASRSHAVERKMAHVMNGRNGYWVIPPGGHYGVR
eukprot:SAG11_NODE_2258_length_3613_cov_1.480364_1_plen_271_part_00